MTIPCRRIRFEHSLSCRHCGRRLLLLLCQSGRRKDQEYAGNNGCSHSGLLDQKWDEHYRREHYRRVAHSSPVLARVGFPPTTFAAPPTRGPRRARFWPAGVEAPSHPSQNPPRLRRVVFHPALPLNQIPHPRRRPLLVPQRPRPPFQLPPPPPQVFPVQTCRTSHPPRPQRTLSAPLQLPRPPAHRLPMHPHPPRHLPPLHLPRPPAPRLPIPPPPPRHLRRPYPFPQQPRGSNPTLLQCR